ncbi:P-loop containing nucleoside triphosphate hydrolase protein [Rozella allomycis CSF55]|uniref:ATP-dependent RNA helicase n=1 Tax=Rozella allomycis (strain CSF55) TaxID=988480 RepID=A0A4P9YFG6_ROZAC|nr:P-loop containing nucleoside triphosphate hydrolase protein [Rozella allomycis CSF55]
MLLCRRLINITSKFQTIELISAFRTFSTNREDDTYLFSVNRRLQSNFFPKKELDFEKQGEELIITPTFHDLGLKKNLIDKIAAFGIKEPTVVQSETINYMLAKRDVLIRCQTGSGKTFGIILALLSMNYGKDEKLGSCTRQLFVVPNIPLANQVYMWCKRIMNLPEHTVEFQNSVRLLAGPMHNDDASDFRLFKRKGETTFPKLIIGTPKRILEEINKKTIDLFYLRTLVLDESDSLIQALNSGARERRVEAQERHPPPTMLLLNKIKEVMHRKNPLQIIACSATLTQPTRNKLRDLGFFERAMFINVGDGNKPPVQIEHSILTSAMKEETPEDWMEQIPIKISNILKNLQKVSALIVTMPDIKGAELSCKLKKLGISNGFLQDIKNDRLSQSIILCSESEVRGIDLPSLDLVIVVGSPSLATSYIHICGRVGRMDKNGQVILIPKNAKEIVDLQRTLKTVNDIEFNFVEYDKDVTKFINMTMKINPPKSRQELQDLIMENEKSEPSSVNEIDEFVEEELLKQVPLKRTTKIYRNSLNQRHMMNKTRNNDQNNKTPRSYGRENNEKY